MWWDVNWTFKLAMGIYHKRNFPNVLIFVVIGYFVTKGKLCQLCDYFVTFGNLDFIQVLPLDRWNLEEYCVFYQLMLDHNFLTWPWCARITSKVMLTMWFCLLQSTYSRPWSLTKTLSSFDLIERNHLLVFGINCWFNLPRQNCDNF